MRWLVPTFHPAYIGRDKRKLEGTVFHDLDRAIGLANGSWRPTWKDDNYVRTPTLSEVESICKRFTGKRISLDTESDGRHPLVCDVRCVSMSDGELHVNIPLLHRTGEYQEVVLPGKKKPVRRAVWDQYYKGEVRTRVLGALRKLFDSARAGKTHIIGFQNRQFDAVSLKKLGIELPTAASPHNDAMLSHHLVASYLPHGLGFLTSLYTDCVYYKETEEGEGWTASTDHDLWTYACRDAKAQWIAGDRLDAERRERPEDVALYEHDAWQEAQCQAWREVGIRVDVEALEFFQHHYGRIKDRAIAAMRDVLGDATSSDIKHRKLNELMEFLQDKISGDEEALDDNGAAVELFNPGSLHQLRMLLQGLGVPLTHETATGQLSTAKDFLLGARKELLDAGAKPDDRRIAFLDYLFAWRESTKIIGTYLEPDLIWHKGGAVHDGVYYAEFDECIRDAEQRDWKELLAGGWVPYIHPSFSVHIVPSGRLSSQRPNFQNQPGEIRGIYVADPGHKLSAGDWDSLEMRLSGILSGDPSLLADFAAYDAGIGPKIHIANTAALFNLPLSKDIPDKYPGCYRAAKVFAYLLAYGGGAKLCYEKMREEMPDLDWDGFQRCFNAYKKKRARLFEYQADVVRRGSRYQHLDTPIWKRRVYFFERVFGEDSPEAAAMQNLPCQGGAADVVGRANRRVNERVLSPLRAKYGWRTHQKAQIHDELLYQVPEEAADKFNVDFKRVAEEIEPTLGHKLPVDVKAKKRWKGVVLPCAKKIGSTQCGDPVTLEPKDQGEGTITWAGECAKCKTAKRIEVPRRWTTWAMPATAPARTKKGRNKKETA